MLLLTIIVLLMLYYKFRKRVPILMYHRIADVSGDRNALPPNKFEAQLAFLARNGYHSITLSDLDAALTTQKPLPPKPVVLTFDDGYKDNLTTALPLLQKYKMVATVFPIACWVGKENKWENFNKQLTTTMNWDELHSWLAAGMEIGAHTANHPFLSHCDRQELATELQVSKNMLTEKLGIKIDYLCYPYGDFDAETKIAAKQAGYRMALAIFDHVPLWSPDLLALPRIPIPAKQKMWEFRLKVSSVHLIFVALRKWERDFKRLFK